VDTPGFDDNHRSETEILRELANSLNAAYKSNIRLTGIVYLHRISDVRVGVSDARNMRLFMKLCGDESLTSVVLATTMWDCVPVESGVDRERDLQVNEGSWRTMILHGSHMFRHNARRESAAQIINYLINRRQPTIIAIQREMIDQDMILARTEAGTEVVVNIEKRIKYHEKKLEDLEPKLQNALAQRNSEEKQELQEFQAECLENIRREQENMQKLQADAHQLCEDMKQRYEGYIKEIDTMMKQREADTPDMYETIAEQVEKKRMLSHMTRQKDHMEAMYGVQKCQVM
jgi:hypothetical protein